MIIGMKYAAKRAELFGRAGGWRTLAAVAGIALLAFLIIGRADRPRYRRLQAEGVGTDGWVTAKDLIGRKKVHYSFMADGRLYSGVGRPGYGNREFEELSVGDKVIVFYLPKDPDVSSLGDPKEHLRDQDRDIVLSLLIFIPVILWFLSRELKRAAGESPG